jgi:hypothetical protein
MKISRPLVNPTPKDIENISTTSTFEDFESKDKFKQSRAQMGFGIDDRDEKLQQFVSSVKSRLKRRLDFVEVSKVWKSPSVPFMIVSFLFNIFILLIGGLFKFSSLPPRIQLFYEPLDKTWIPSDKFLVIVVVPIIVFCLFLILYRIIKIIFRIDHKLAETICWIITFFNVLLLIAVSQIYILNRS